MKVYNFTRNDVFYIYFTRILYCFSKSFTAWKVSKYGVFSGTYFSVFGPGKLRILTLFTQCLYSFLKFSFYFGKSISITVYYSSASFLCITFVMWFCVRLETAKRPFETDSGWFIERIYIWMLFLGLIFNTFNFYVG